DFPGAGTTCRVRAAPEPPSVRPPCGVSEPLEVETASSRSPTGVSASPSAIATRGTGTPKATATFASAATVGAVFPGLEVVAEAASEYSAHSATPRERARYQ